MGLYPKEEVGDSAVVESVVPLILEDLCEELERERETERERKKGGLTFALPHADIGNPQSEDFWFRVSRYLRSRLGDGIPKQE